MKNRFSLLLLLLLTACVPLSVKQGGTDPRFWFDPDLGRKNGLFGYRVQVEVSDAGSRIEVNDELVATMTATTGEIVLWGDPDGTFHGSGFTRIAANPVKPGQHKQVKSFPNGGTGEEIPHHLYFDLNLAPQTNNVERVLK